MKILYLLFAVFFLVLQAAPEFSEAQRLDRHRGCFCTFRRCPLGTRNAGRCGRGVLCCPLRF